VSASCLTSSAGPSSAIRSCSAAGASAIRRAVSVIRCNGCSIRPAISQPSAIAAAVTTSSAMPPWVSSVCRVLSRLSAAIRIDQYGRPFGGGTGPFNALIDAPPTGSRCETSTYVAPSRTRPATRNRLPYTSVSRPRTVSLMGSGTPLPGR